MPKSVKDVLFPPLLPLFLRLAQRLANQNESSQRYEALRVAWNCLLRVAAILRGIRGTPGEFLPTAAALLQMLPAILPRVGTAGKSFVCRHGGKSHLRGVTGAEGPATGQPALSRPCDSRGVPHERGGVADAGGGDGASERVDGGGGDVCGVLCDGAEIGGILGSCLRRTARR